MIIFHVLIYIYIGVLLLFHWFLKHALTHVEFVIFKNLIVKWKNKN
jgi:hypothetical protein